MYSNNTLVQQLISLLKQFGIKRIVVSPGGRHVQLVLSLEQDDYFELYSVVDERSAAFFAIGLIQATGEPAAITCSSGTACMNYGSAITEAYYQRLPLLVLSADRLPAFLNQGEEQMYNQLEPFRSITKYHVQLPEINSELDKWHCNRLINEALLELTHHGRGPVHINFPMRDIFGPGFDTPVLPKVRKINMHSASADFSQFISKLEGKRIMLVWGQSVPERKLVGQVVNQFIETYNAVVLTDCISNCPLDHAIKNTFVVLQTLSQTQQDQLAPDIVLSIGGNQVFNTELKHYLSSREFDHWQIGPQNQVCDPYHKLTDVFEMDEATFFNKLLNTNGSLMPTTHTYYNLWKECADVAEPNCTEFNEVSVIGGLINKLPMQCNLQLANSNTIRIASYFKIPNSIEVHCNRGVNGIDGSMSTAIGYASCKSIPTFYITGELSFFYDMNSLWIKHVTPELRILLINNDGGAFMYSKRRIINGRPSLTLAADNHVSAKGWAEAVGFKYLSANNYAEYATALEAFISATSDKPIVLEVNTIMSDDRVAADAYIQSLDRRTIMDKVQDRLGRSKFNIFK